MVTFPFAENKYGFPDVESENPEKENGSVPSTSGPPCPEQRPFGFRSYGSRARRRGHLPRRTARIFVFSILLCILVVPTSSRPGLAWQPGTTEIAGYIGGLFLGERPNLADAPVFGGRLVTSTGRRSAVEISVGMSPTNSLADPEFVVNVFFVHMDICYNIGAVPDLWFVRSFPFLVLGIGAIDYDPGGSKDAEKDAAEFAINFGIGGEFRFDETLAFRMDLRDFVARLEFDEFPLDDASETRSLHPKLTHNVEISAGLAVTF